MRKLQSVCIALLGLIAPLITAQTASAPKTAKTVTNAQVSSIEVVVGQVKQALAAVQTTLDANDLPPLKEVKLSLQTVATKKGGATLKLWVINIGGTWERDKVT